MIGVVVSRADVASTNIRDSLLDVGSWEEREASGNWKREWVNEDGEFVMVEKEGLHLYYDGVDAEIRDEHEVNLVVFASRHSGDTGPLLTVHHTGNFGEAEFGGEDRSLAKPAPESTRTLLRYFDSEKPEGYDVTLEATHHGPTEIETPSLFAEVGSGEEEWEDDEAAEVVGRGILSLTTDTGVKEEKETRTAVGVGGGHYAPRFTRLALETETEFGHIAAGYAVEEIDEEMMRAAFRLSEADCVVPADETAEELGFDIDEFEVVTESEIRRRSGVDPELADVVEDVIGEKAVFTSRARDVEGIEGVRKEDITGFDAELVREARRTDREAADARVDENALGYVEDEDGVVRNVAVERSRLDVIAEELADVLRKRYDTVRVEGESVTAERRVFDPEKARSLGVPEGPEFGRLAEGESVEVDGKEVSPEEVSKRERTEFEVP